MNGLEFVWASSRRRLTKLLVLSMAIGCSAALPLLFIGSIVEALVSVSTSGTGLHRLVLPVSVLAASLAVERLLTVLRDGMLDVLAFDVRLAAEERIVRAATAARLEDFERAEFYDRVERATQAATIRPLQLAQSLLQTTTSVAGGIGTAAAVIALEPATFGVALLSFLPLWYLVQRRGSIRMTFIVDATPTERRTGYFLSVLTIRETARELRSIRSAAGFLNQERLAWLERRGEEVRREVRQLRNVDIVGLALGGLATVVVWVVVILFLTAGQGSVGDVVAFVFAFQRLRGFLSSLVWGLSEAGEAGILMKDVRALEEGLEPPRHSQPTRESRLGDELREIVLSGVTYSYPNSPIPALRSVNCRLRRGEFVAIVGENGCGKSTLVNVLSLLLPPTSGSMTWNGVHLCADCENVQELRDRLGVVYQESFPFAVSAVDNVALGRSDGDRSMDLLREVGMLEALVALPDREKTLLGREFDGGSELSGGQWQRLLIARGLYCQGSQGVILDEASSGLDPVAEFELVRTIKQLCHDKLVVVVSHRLSSIIEADRVLVMKAGEIVEEGVPRELLQSQSSTFAQMFNVQARTLGVVQS